MRRAPVSTPIPSVRRIAVIGDVGGHREALVSELFLLGADPHSGRLPLDLAIVQVGDLVHRGPESGGVVALVDAYLRDQPGQWVQLVGNHEAQYLREPAFAWPEQLDEDAAGLLRQWWSSGSMRVGVAIEAETGDYLVTHAGLTSVFWRDELGSPALAGDAAEALNALARTADATVFRPGELLGARVPRHSAGPLWASAATELLPSWQGIALPFNQIHGHSSLRDWRTGTTRGTDDLVAATDFDASSKHEVTTMLGGAIIGIDPCHGQEPQPPWRSRVLRLRDDTVWTPSV